MRRQRLAFEEANNANNETEVELFAKITNFAGLQECDAQEEHEQWEGAFANGVKCRVRKTTTSAGVEYTFTYKKKSDKAGAVKAVREHNVSVDEAFYEDFKSVASHYLHKRRYKFKVHALTYLDKENNHISSALTPDTYYEVDVFTDIHGAVSPFCKIDLEVDNLLQLNDQLKNIKLNVKVSHLPFAPVGTFITNQATPEQKELLDRCWKSWRLSPTQRVSEIKHQENP